MNTEGKRIARYQIGDEVGRSVLEGDGSLRVLSGPPITCLDDVKLLPPVQPTKVVGVGLNYRAHAREMSKPIPQEPLLFLMPATAVIACHQPIVRPGGFERVDYEGELGVVFGKRARNVLAQDAEQVIGGYVCVNDVTVRDLQSRDGQYTRAKGFDTFLPMGPVIATGLDPMRLDITTRVDGELRQQSNTADMIFDVATLVETVTRVMTMLPGDVITTGTPPGVGQLRPGALIEVNIEGIGSLVNPVVAETCVGGAA